MTSQLLDKLMDYGPYLPLTITEHSHNRVIRIAGLIGFCIWWLPVMAILIVPALILMWVEIFEGVWRGK